MPYLADLFIVLSTKLVALGVAVYYLRYLQLPYRLALLQVLVAICAETAGKYIAIKLHSHNLWLFNYYWLAELWIMGYAGYLLSEARRFKKLVPYMMGISTLLWAILLLANGQGTHPIPAIVSICLCLSAIYLSILSTSIVHSSAPLRTPSICLSISVLLFFACSLPYYSLFNFLYNNAPGVLVRLFTIVEILNFARYLILAYVFYLHGKERLSLENK